MPPPELNFSDVLNDLTPSVVSSASVGGSRVMVPADERASHVHDVFDIFIAFPPGELGGTIPEPTTPPPPPPLPEELGPFSFNPIVFDDGVPVGGWAQLTLFRSGVINFSGHLHVSGAPSYDTACVYAVRGGDKIYTFVHTGRVHGTFEAGSRDDDWGEGPTHANVAEGWPSLAADLSWHASATVNPDIGAFVDAAVKAVGAAATVIAII
jgi:hypothetical protein